MTQPIHQPQSLAYQCKGSHLSPLCLDTPPLSQTGPNHPFLLEEASQDEKQLLGAAASSSSSSSPTFCPQMTDRKTEEAVGKGGSTSNEPHVKAASSASPSASPATPTSWMLTGGPSTAAQRPGSWGGREGGERAAFSELPPSSQHPWGESAPFPKGSSSAPRSACQRPNREMLSPSTARKTKPESCS